MKMSGSVKDKVVIVTGAGRGLGAGMAADLAKNGARVVVADLNRDGAAQVAEEIKGAGGEAFGTAVDVSNREQVKAMIAEVVRKYGRLDVMFNNAGISQTCPFLEVTDSDFDRLMAVNGRGVLIGSQEAARQMIAQGGGGKIVNTTSIGGKQGWPLYAHYCASKFAVVALTQAAARALGEHKITVNCFAPGVVATELWNQLDEDSLKYGVTQKKDQLIKDFSQGILLGRVSTPKDVSGVTTFLASDASDYITGQTIMVDGGMVLI
jgi:meso-butanediol dehydrogenase / (S,S)-butanediol dehydrogenase / diacetyl reductase